MALAKCRRTGECFGRTPEGYCEVLTSTKETCSFQKPDKEVTNGKRYPYDPNYGVKTGGVPTAAQMMRW